jgi:phosphoglycerol transferase MdoB-like AlkP superfamily enzyme
MMLLALFAALRAGLIWRTWTPGAATRGQLLWSFVVGARFDLAMACYLCIPITVACYVPWLAPWRGPRTRRAFLWIWSTALASLMFVLLCEYEFFGEFQSRFNQIAVRYFNHPATVGGMVWYNYPVLKYLAAGLAVFVLVHVGMRLSLRWSYPPATLANPAPIRWPREVIGATALVLLLVFGSRGGFQNEPLRWGDAFRGDSEYANQMSLNGLYSLANAIKDMSSRGREGAKWTDPDQVAVGRRAVQRLIVAPGERLIDPDQRTVLRQGDVGSGLTLRGKDGRPINVVVVMMESFSARYVGACGAARSFTPSFDALAREGILFDRTLSAGTHTHQGIFAIQLGFPNLPGYETLMESGVANQPFRSAARIFGDRGYRTMFLYNGDFAWDNMRGFFNKQGVDRFIGRDEMAGDARYVDEVWGVSDGDVFTRANREFEAASKEGPFYATIMTLSNHAPFQVPPVPGAAPITDQGEYNGRLTAMRYADWAVGQFVAEARKLSYFQNTLFVFVGDHGFHVPPMMTELHLLYHHVPLLFFAPALTDQGGRVEHRIASHNNVIPSILGLLGITDSPHAAWARSLFNDAFADENFAVFKNSGGGPAIGLARGDKLLVLGSAIGKPLLLRFDLGPAPTFAKLDDAAAEQSMSLELRAYVRAALDDLGHNRAGAAARPGPGAAGTHE